MGSQAVQRYTNRLIRIYGLHEEFSNFDFDQPTIIVGRDGEFLEPRNGLCF